MEKNKLYNKQLPAREVYEALCYSRQKCGTPYLLNKDSINEKNAQSNIGTIRLSNLCTEILEYADEKNIAVCNLTSIALPMFIKPCAYSNGYLKRELDLNLNKDLINIISSYLPQNDKYFDFLHFGRIVEMCVENCDRIIDINLYPVKETKRANKSQRPIGLGVQGLSDVYKMLKYAWSSKEASNLNKSIFSVMYYYFLKKTNELGLKYGSYPKFKGSPASKGILQYHMWKQQPDTSVITKQQWTEIECNIQRAMRNSLGLSLMPTASSSQILGNIESIEVSTYNLYTRSTLSGNFYCLDKHLYKELKDLGMWTPKIIDQIIKDRGSVQNLNISKELKEIYKTVWELSQKYVIDQSADRGPYIDQTQSLNIHIAIPNLAILSSMDLYSWKKGLKTLSYYTRGKSAMDSVMFTIMDDQVGIKVALQNEETNKKEMNKEEEMAKSVCYKGCLDCSS
jgi:ribonucleoside-diphosphate reductase subunit M1